MKVAPALIAAILAIGLPAHAQQQTITPSQMALQVDGIINQWAQQLEALQQQNAALQRQVSDLTAKCGEACKPVPPAAANHAAPVANPPAP
jgi:hypothetical protein